MKESRASLENGLYRCGWVILIILSALVLCKRFLFLNLFSAVRMPLCVFHTLTGYFCPGCGGTRSLKA